MSCLLYDKALKYAQDVVAGEEITTKEVKMQCSWFLRDLELQYEEEYPYYFDYKKIKIVNNLCKIMNFATGIGVQGKSVLEGLHGFQAFFLVNIFGWRFKDNPNKFKHRDNTLFIPRKNAKTFIVALVLIILMLTEQEYSEFYSICIDRDLASEVKKAMNQIISASPSLSKYFNIPKSLNGKVECKLNNSFYQPRTSQANSNNAIRPSAFIFDEAGAFTDYNNYSAMKSGQLSVENPLRFIITTAYAVDNSIMINELEYIRKVYSGLIEDDRRFSLLYYADEENLWTEKGLYMSNPLRIEANYEEIRANRKKAQANKSEEAEYFTKHCNHFVSSVYTEAFVELSKLQECKIAPDDFNWKGRRVFAGLDLSMSLDNTSLMLATEENGIIYTKGYVFYPASKTLEKTHKEKLPYQYFVDIGQAIPCGDLTIDYSVIEDKIINLEQELGIQLVSLGYDNKFAPSTISRLENEGIDCVSIRQHSTVLGNVIQLLQNSILNNTFRYEDSKLFESNVQGVKISYDNGMNMWINKKKSNGKIDMVAGLLNAMYLLQQEMIENIENSEDFMVI